MIPLYPPTTPREDGVPEEAKRILDALIQTRYERSSAARLLGMSRTTLWRKMREYRL